MQGEPSSENLKRIGKTLLLRFHELTFAGISRYLSAIGDRTTHIREVSRMVAQR